MQAIAVVHLLCRVFPRPGGQGICLETKVQTVVPVLAIADQPVVYFACKELDAWRKDQPLNHLGCQPLTPVTQAVLETWHHAMNMQSQG